MSSSADAVFLVQLAAALRRARLDAIIVGNAASILNGAPVTTQDVDLLIRDTASNRQKLARFADLVGGLPPVPLSELSNAERILGAGVPIGVLFDSMAGGLKFASVRSRAEKATIDGERLVYATLADVIRSKRAANREKDRAVLPILQATLKTLKALDADKRKGK